MFDFGNDDKEKLRENMEQIKEMVEDGKAVGEEVGDEAGLGEDFETGFDEGAEQSTGASQQSQSFENSGTDSFDPVSQNGSGGEMEEELDEFEEKFGEEQQDTWQEGQQSQQPAPQEPQQQQLDETASDTPPSNQQRSKTTQAGLTDSRNVDQLSSEVPSPPETREIDVPEIDRGPLFLRQQKFLRAKQMIEDMLYLADDMERTVNDLEAGLQEDQGIERDVREILMEFEDNRTAVEDIISPREE